MPSKELIEQFETRYGIPGAFEAMDARTVQFKHLDNFLSTAKENPKQQYVRGIVNMLSLYAEHRIAPSGNGNGYSLQNMNTIQFIRDYEEIMQTRHEELNPGVKRRAYDGADAIRVMDEAAACMETYSKPLVDLWAERIKIGAFSLDNMRGHTDMLHNELRNKNSLENTVDRRAAETAVLIHAAMAKVTAERGWGWKLNPFNWVRWYQESRYMSQLAAQQPTYDGLGMSLDSVTQMPEYSMPATTEHETIREHKAARIAERQAQNAEKAVETVETENIKETLNLDPDTLEPKPVVQAPVVQAPVVQAPVVQAPVVQAPVVQEPVVQEPVVEEPVVEEPVVEEPVVEEPVVEEPMVATAPQSELNYPEELDKLVKDNQVTARVVSGLSDILREAGYTDEKTIERIAEYVQDCVYFLVDEYDSLSNPDLIRPMRQVTKEMFTSAYELMNESPIGLSIKDQVVAAQKLTNLMMRTYTLAAFDREQYGKYANDYVVNRKDVLAQRMKHFYGKRSQEEINSIIQDVQEAYEKPVNEEKKELNLHEQLKADTSEKPIERPANQVEEQMTTEEPAVQEPVVGEPKPEGITVETVSENVEEIAMDFLDGMMNDIDASLNIKSEAQTIEELTDDPMDDIENPMGEMLNQVEEQSNKEEIENLMGVMLNQVEEQSNKEDIENLMGVMLNQVEEQSNKEDIENLMGEMLNQIEEQSNKEDIENLMGEMLNQVEEQSNKEDIENLMGEMLNQVEEQSNKEDIENLMGEMLTRVEEQMTTEEPAVQEPVVQEPVVQETVVQETVVQEPTVQEPVVGEPKPEGITVETVSENVEEIAMDFLDGMMNDIDASLNIKSEAQTIEELTDDPMDDIPNWVEDEDLPFMERYEKRLANKELADRTRNQVTAIIRRAGVTNKNILDDVVGETFDIRKELTLVYRGLKLSEIESNMGDIATYVHGRAYEYLKNSGLDAKERFITAQHVANLMMRFYSPVAFGDEGMEKYAENYVVSNTDILKKRLGVHVFPGAAFDPNKGYEIKMKIEALASEITDEFVRIGAIDAPVVEEPVVEKPVVEEPVVEESEDEELEVEESVDEESETEELEVEESKVEAIKTETPRKTDAVGKPLNMSDAWKLRNNRTLTQAIQNQLSEFMDKYKTPNTNFVTFGLHKDVDRFWLAFSNAKNGKDESKMQRTVKEYSINIFESVYASTRDMAGENLSTADKIIAVQKITNLWLNTYSPVASDSSYAEYGDNYFVKHADPKTLREDPLFYGESVESLDKALQEAKFELGIVEKLQVNLSAEFSEKPVERSAKVAETQAPTKTQVRE